MNRPISNYRGAVAWMPLLVSASIGWFSSTVESSEVNHGFLRETYVDDHGKTFKYVVFIPMQRESDDKLPVILFLNGWGENGDDGLRQISNNFGSDVWRMRSHFPFLAVCPQCSYEGSWSPGSENAVMALAVLDKAIAEHHGDPQHVCISGASVGGAGALSLASAYPDRFAAVVPVAVRVAGDLDKLAAVGMPIWCFYNGKDEHRLADSAREMRRELLTKGLSPLVTEFDSVGHNAWDSAYGPPVLYRWILENNFDNRNSKPYTLLSPSQILAEWKQQGPGTWSADKDELTSKISDGHFEAHIESQPMAPSGEFHLDTFLQSDSRCRLAILAGNGTGVLRTEVLLQLSGTGLAGVRDATTGDAIALDPVGQRALRTGWNDLRLGWSNDRFKLLINGWPALNQKILLGERKLSIALMMVPGDPPMRWRFIRLRNKD